MASIMDSIFINLFRVFIRHAVLAGFSLCLLLGTLEWLMPGFASPLVNLPMWLGAVGALLIPVVFVETNHSLIRRRLISTVALIPVILWVGIVYGNEGRYGFTATLIFACVMLLFAWVLPTWTKSEDTLSS